MYTQMGRKPCSLCDGVGEVGDTHAHTHTYTCARARMHRSGLIHAVSYHTRVCVCVCMCVYVCVCVCVYVCVQDGEHSVGRAARVDTDRRRRAVGR